MEENRYKLIEADELNSFFIKEIETNSLLYSIFLDCGTTHNLLLVNDLKTLETASKKLKKEDIINRYSYLTNKLFFSLTDDSMSLSDNFNKELFLDIFIPSYKHFDAKVNGRRNKLYHFKLNIIRENLNSSHLCNCVKGFFPETEFILDEKGSILFKHNKQRLTYEQEQKVWEFLFKNPKRVGHVYTPSVFDYCLRKKIEIQINEEHFKVPISYIRKVDYNHYKIKVIFNNKEEEIKKLFTDKELIDKVIYSR